MNLQYIKQQLTTILTYRGCKLIPYDTQTKTLILKQANELVEHIFTFDKPWDMERCTTPYQLPQIIDWDVCNHDDEEWTFMLNRMDYLNYLIQAYSLNNQLHYLTTCKDFIFQWIHAHPKLTPSKSTRTLDSAIRLSNMMDATTYLYHYHALNDEELNVITTYMLLQIEYLYDQYIPKYTLSNWGSIQTCVIISLLPILSDDYKKHKIFLWAKHELEIQVNIQVYTDGMFWEQSTMYHIEVLNYLMKTIYMNSILLLKISKTIFEKAYALANSLALQVTPHYEIEAYGDSDRCSIRDIFVRAAYIFKNPFFKYIAGSTFDHESAYVLGSHPALVFQQILPKVDSHLYFNGEDSGMFSVRSSWQDDASYTMFTNGSLGSGHGHCDNLHVSLYYGGNPFLIDTGRYSYKEEEVLRPYFKSMYAHNCIVIDEAPHSLPKGSWDYLAFGILVKTYVKHESHIHYFEGSIIDEKTTGIHTRKLIVIDPAIWFVCDELKMQGDHTITQFFHLDPSVHFQEDHCLLTNGKNALKVAFHQQPSIHQEPCSLRYNELQTHTLLQVHDQFKDTHTMCTSFYDSAIEQQPVFVYQDDKIIPNEVVSAFKFIISSQENYKVILFHKEIYKGRKICFCEGVPFHAKSVVIHTKDGRTNVFNLKC